QDADGLTDSATVTVTVNPVNDAPVAMDDTATTDENTKVVIDVLANDSDPDGDDLTIINPTVDAAQGTAIVEDGKIVFTPAAGFSGEASIAYSVQDAGGLTDSATVTVTVNSVNTPPLVDGPLASETAEDEAAYEFDLLVGASDADGGTLLVDETSIKTDGEDGLADGFTLDGKMLTIDPANAAFQSLKAGETKDIVITYNILDGQGGSVSQTATITITGVNDAPTITGPLSYETSEDNGVYPLNLLETANDIDGDDLNIANLSGLEDGLVLDGNVLKIDPSNAAFQALAEGETKVIDLSYDIVDGQGGSVSQTAKITINGVNDDPVISGDFSGDVSEDDVVSASGVLSIADPDNGQSSFTPATDLAGTYGMLDIAADGSWTYTLDNDNPLVQALSAKDSVTDSITVTSVDGTEQVITLTLTGANDLPEIEGKAQKRTVDESSSAESPVTADGLFSVIDLDTVANASASVELIQLKGNGKNKFDRDALSDLDMLDLDLQPTDDPTKGALNWTFNSESDDGSIETFGALGANQTLKLVYKITVEHADDPSLNDSKNITITIKGAEGNAQPEIVPTVEEAEAETEDLAPDTNADAGDVVPVQALPSLADASFGPSAETEPAPQTLERDAASELFEGMSMDSSHLGEMIAMVNANSDLIERGSPLTGVKVSKEGNQAGDLHSIDAAVVDQLAEELALFHQESAEQDLMA
ncbi:MAG: Ig-like domain-containing protein, partial [Cohaesibacter sp.]|nr:Ig-like domain-containing protein [Cohaesibacter sp.]